MEHFIGKLYERISYKQRREKKLTEVCEKFKKYSSMSIEEFSMDYATLSVRYNHTKHILSFLSVTFIASVLASVWTYFYKIIEFSFGENINLVETAFRLGVFWIAIILIGLISFIVYFLRQLNELEEEKILMEQIKEVRH